ncbi:GNAT family N-acetyltransferase [Allocoleopsis franciscana]|uniref:Acetyltransferase n=1 Tax=Allocoleopsis franciscana PCC 7113 TaxID=1173027 RepID=K9WAJ5_9CYAN|nr:GNAT family N-acetyltransferase [Allocoleopsis franciscana]AFZ16789.1 acetyltransferase [Allocoleopsis franciscana PCC 7113]
MAINGSVEKATGSTNSAPLQVSSSLPNIRLPDTLVTTYLQMTDWSQFRPAYLNYLGGMKLMCMGTPDVAFYRFLYSSVGEEWRWRERLSHSDEEIKALLLAPGTSIHVLYVNGVPAGYIELAERREGPTGRFFSTEIVYFGLRSTYMGRGLGKHLLSHGIAYAWNRGTQRLWVHTCNLDGPHALNNYIKRGFKIYRVDKEPMPERYL